MRRQQEEVARERFAQLTEIEREVLSYVMRGHMNKEIAMDLDIHERTVKLHRAAMMAKLRAKSLAELMAIWIRHLSGKSPSANH